MPIVKYYGANRYICVLKKLGVNSLSSLRRSTLQLDLYMGQTDSGVRSGEGVL